MRHTRAIALVLLVALVICMALPAALAEESFVTLAVDTVNGASGGEVDVSIEIHGCEAVDSLQFNLNYDATALKPLRATPGTVFPAEYCVTNIAESGRVRAACISAEGLSDEDGGTLLTVTFQILTGTGSAVTLSDVIATRVDGEYNQTRAYLQVTDGGVTAGAAALPAPVTTPWIAETPVPTPSPTPEPTIAPTPAVFADETPLPTVTPEPQSASPAMLPYLIVGVFAILAAAAIVVVLIAGGKTSRRRRKKRRRKKKKTARRD